MSMWSLEAVEVQVLSESCEEVLCEDREVEEGVWLRSKRSSASFRLETVLS